MSSNFDVVESDHISDIASKLNPYKGYVKTHIFTLKVSVWGVDMHLEGKMGVFGCFARGVQGGPGRGSRGLKWGVKNCLIIRGVGVKIDYFR